MVKRVQTTQCVNQHIIISYKMVQNQVITSSPSLGQDASNTLSSTSSTDMTQTAISGLSQQTPMESVGQISIFHPQSPNNLTSYLDNENPSVIGIDNSYITNLHPESFYNISSTSSPFPENETLDNMKLAENLANIAFHCEDEFTKSNKSRKRNDSTDSMETVGSSSSGEIFNSDYTDTVSSTEFLLKSSTDSEEESSPEGITGSDSEANFCNEGYMSCSSTEVLNDSDEGSQEDLLSITVEDDQEEQAETETKPMLPEESSVCLDIDTDSDVGKILTDFVQHPLTPIKENEIVSFAIEEVEPSQYTKITDNIVVVDESFLFNSISNFSELEYGNKRTRAQTMFNIHERSSFLDLTEVSKVGRVCQKALVYLKGDITMGSLASLNTIQAKENSKDPIQSLSLISNDKKENVLKKSNYMKNLLAISITVTLLYIAVGSVRNLQSSINHEGGVGVIGLAVNFLGYVVGSVFSSSIVQTFQPRRCLIVNLFPNLLYIAANLYPTMWVMVPISLIQGISLAIVANATSTYITFLAKGSMEKTKETFAEVSCRFFGIYCLMYTSHLIIGNLIASLILQPPEGSEGTNTTGMFNNLSLAITHENATTLSKNASHLKHCGSNFCQHFEIGGSSFAVDLETKYLLFGVYMGCILLAIITAFFFMEPLDRNLFKSTVSPFKKLKSQMISLTKFFVNVKFILLLPLMMHSAMQFGFLSAEFVKGYITCPLGIHMIGYTMICFGICSSLSSYLCGLLNKYVGSIPFIVLASLNSLTKLPNREVLKIPALADLLLSVCCNG